MDEKYYAHTPNDLGEWHLLDCHLRNVAEKARKFADKFKSGPLAYWIGLWHDIGKSNPKFQDYLMACAQDVKHDGAPHSI